MPDTPAPGTEGQASAAQAPAQVTPNSNAQASAQGAGSGPWASQLAQFDESVRPQVDSFLRTQVQPYTTRLEQQLAQSKQATDLWDSLQAEPAAAYLSITEELFGEEAVDAVIELLTGDDTDDADPSATPAADTVDQPARDPEVEELLEERRLTKRKTAYDAELARTKESHTVEVDGKRVPKEGDVEIIDDLFHPFVQSSEGNFDVAYEGYKQYYAQFRSQFAPATEAPARDVPPNTLGSDTSTQAAPPTQPTHESIDDALDSIFADLAAAPPVMGGV